MELAQCDQRFEQSQTELYVAMTMNACSIRHFYMQELLGEAYRGSQLSEDDAYQLHTVSFVVQHPDANPLLL
jgi:hypothetical protein